MSAKLAAMNAFLMEAPLHQWLRGKITAFDEEAGTLEMILPMRAELGTTPGEAMAHGGIVSTLVDMAAHAAVHGQTGHGVPTVDLRVDYLRPATMPLSAKALTRRIGRTLGCVDVEVFDRDGALVALGRASFLTRAPAMRMD